MEAVLQVWADRCSHGTRTENFLWGYHFNIREERCLIRKAAGAELKTSDQLISIQDPFQGAFAGLYAANFDFVFQSGQMCFRLSTWADKETVSQEDVLDCLLHDQALDLTLTLSHRAQKPGRLQDGQDNKEGRMSLWHTHTHTRTVWHTLCQSRHVVNQRADFIRSPDACFNMTFKSTWAQFYDLPKWHKFHRLTHKHQLHGPNCATTLFFFFLNFDVAHSSFSASLVKYDTPEAFLSKQPLREWG